MKKENGYKQRITETIIAGIAAGIAVYFFGKILDIDKFDKILPLMLKIGVIFIIVLFGYLIRYYWKILDGSDKRRGAQAWGKYDGLRARLIVGGTPAKVYSRWLTLALDRVDRFFGDAGRDDVSWFSRRLGLQTPGPRWTAPAFDKCLILALVYPLVTIFMVWVWSGQVGVAEHALGLLSASEGMTDVWRWFTGLAVAIQVYAFWRSFKTSGWKTLIWLAFAIAIANVVPFGVAIAFDSAVIGAMASAGSGALIVASVVAVAGSGAVANAGATTGTVVLTFAFAGAFLATVSFALSGTVNFIGSNSKRRLGVFLSLFLPGMLLAVACLAWFLVPLPKWNLPGALLMFFGLLPLVNAPFDWAAIGLTRALLRRGLAPGGPGPYFYALVDACIGALLVIVLAFATVLAVQTFDDIAVLRAGPGARILPLAPLFDGLAERPGDPEFWWVWLMLFSSQIPSFVNLVIAAAAFLRGLPGLTSWIVRRMPADKPVRENDRLLLAGALAGQIVGGPLITGALLYGLAVYVIPLGMPLLGTMIRDFSEQLAAYNAPAHVMMWLSKGH